MKTPLFLATALALSAVAIPAAAQQTLVDHGITYTLTQNSITNGGLTGNYTLGISGINTASDEEGGRTGINSFAFNDAPFAVSGTSAGFIFGLGGLNSSGCNGSGEGFFCFDNPAIPPTPAGLLGSALSLDFSVTANAAGAWADWAPSFKIDWVGSQNNYDLVSRDIPVNYACTSNCTPPPPPPEAVPEPATWAMMLFGFGAVGTSLRRRRQRTGLIAQLA